LTSVELLAKPDLPTDEGGLALLASTAEDMVRAAVDKLVVASNTDVAFALRDVQITGPLDFDLNDLPVFDKTANPDGFFGLVVDEDDLAALVASLGSQAQAIEALAGKGFNGLVLPPNAQVDEAAQTAAATAGVELVDLGSAIDDLQITQQDLVKLLGQTADPTDPFDPFHKP
jgi:hypothetical protein